MMNQEKLCNQVDQLNRILNFTIWWVTKFLRIKKLGNPCKFTLNISLIVLCTTLLHSTTSAICFSTVRTLNIGLQVNEAVNIDPQHSEGNSSSSQSDTELNTSTHLFMGLADEKRDERQTFELEAKRVRNRRQVRSKVSLQWRLETEKMQRQRNKVQVGKTEKKEGRRNNLSLWSCRGKTV